MLLLKGGPRLHTLFPIGHNLKHKTGYNSYLPASKNLRIFIGLSYHVNYQLNPKIFGNTKIFCCTKLPYNTAIRLFIVAYAITKFFCN